MPPASLQVVADDLSGAAECAAALARALHRPAPLVLAGELPAGGSWAFDTDSRALPAPLAADVASQALRRAALAGEGGFLFKKIDSTLRGHVTAELRATLALPGLVQAAVVCPTLPAQGRTLAKGVLRIHGQPQVDWDGLPLDLPRLLAGAHPHPVLLRPEAAATADELARDLIAAAESGARILVVDASTEDELRRLARALVAAADSLRLLAVGAAGLASALADELLAPEAGGAALPPAPDGPLVAVVGSFHSVTGRQVDELAREPGVHLVRLNASLWFAQPERAAEAVAAARRLAAPGDAIVLAATGPLPVQSSRELVQSMAGAAEPLVRAAGTLVLTGGDTARTVLERLGIERLQVIGELEPGICLSRQACGGPAIVTKAGGFGDSQSLVRVLRHFRGAPPAGDDKEKGTA